MICLEIITVTRDPTGSEIVSLLCWFVLRVHLMFTCYIVLLSVKTARGESSRFQIYRSKRLKMAKFETFGDTSRNIEIRVIWFSELRTVVIVASLC